MQATFPVASFPWRHYLFPALFCVAAAVASFLVYDSLPDTIPTHFDSAGRPDGWSPKNTYILGMLAMMAGMLVLFLLMDRFLLYFSFPVPLLSGIAGSMLLLMLLVHVGILQVYRLEDVPAWQAVAVMLVVMFGYMAVHCYFARSAPPPRPSGDVLWTDRPPHSLLDTVFFFVRPILPSRVEAYPDGFLIIAALYTFAVPWAAVAKVAPASPAAAMAGSGVRIASSPSHAVSLDIDGMKRPLVMSLEDRDRFIAEWKARSGRDAPPS
ncbi:MAG: DUF1648 domain-containing protein [Planctomycetes bacterium]|nr:DUF1648 domain-containing protein [Planctomycetota bacterium]